MQTEHDYISRKEIVEFLGQLEVISEKLHDEIVKCVVDATIGAIRKLLRLAERKEDIVPVIRCADCVHNYDSFAGLVCTCGPCEERIVNDDFYCACGEKRR